MLWIYLVGSGLHPLLAREFAPLAQRLASVTGRLEGIPTIVADARATIGSVPERPVSKLHAEIAGKRIGGVADLGKQAVEAAEAAAPTDAAVALLLPRLRAASDAAAEALVELDHRRSGVAPATTGGPALGEALFARSCGTRCVTRRSRPRRSSPGPSGIHRGAGGDGPDRARGVARWCGDRRDPRRRRGAGPGACSDAIAADHPAADELGRGSAVASSGRVEAFCRERERDRAGRTSRSRSTGRRSTCARSAGRCSDSPGPLDTARRRSSRSRPSRRVERRERRVVPARDERPDAAAPARSTRRCPATTCRWSTRTGARRSRGACSDRACSPRAGPST